MDTPVQIAAGPDAGPPPEAPGRKRLKRAAPIVVAGLILAPGVLLAAPLKQAFADFMVGYEKTTASADMEPAQDGAGFHRHAAARVRRAGSGGSGKALAAKSIPADLSGRAGLLKLADLQVTDGAGGGADKTLADLGVDEAGGAAATERTASDLMSGAAGIGASARSDAAASVGSGFDGGGGGGGGGGFGGGALGSPGANTAGQPASTTGLDAAGPDPSQLGNSLGALSAAPEPAAWISMILGFGLIGATLRRRRGQGQPG